ncbi:hypothetical protein PT2222_90115 [Paraburkholderia tropica]
MSFTTTCRFFTRRSSARRSLRRRRRSRLVAPARAQTAEQRGERLLRLLLRRAVRHGLVFGLAARRRRRFVRLQEEVVDRLRRTVMMRALVRARTAVADALATTFATLAAFSAFTTLATFMTVAIAAAAAAFVMRHRRIDREMLDGQRTLDELFDIGELLFLVRRAQRQRVAGRARAARAADTVHIVFRVERQVEVDDGRQFGDVETARGHVGGHQRLDLAALEGVERLHALALRAVAVNRGGHDALLLDLARETARADLAVAEHDHLLEAAIADQLHDRARLVAFGDFIDDLRDVGVRGVAARDFDGLRRAQIGRRQLLDFRRERGREQQRLTLLRQQVQDALEVGQEAHVEHAVGFVEHEHLHLAEVRGLLLDVVEQTARRRDQDFHAAAQFVRLRIHVDAAEHHRAAQRRVLRVGAHVVGDLVGQLARGREDQRAHRMARGRCARARERQETLEDRQREARGLAGAGLRGAHHVAAREDHGDGLRLDRRGRRVALLLDRSEDLGREAELIEGLSAGRDGCVGHGGFRYKGAMRARRGAPQIITADVAGYAWCRWVRPVGRVSRGPA